MRGATGLSGKESTCSVGDSEIQIQTPGVGKIPWRRNDHHSRLEKSHGQRNLGGHSPQVRKAGRASDNTT